MFCDHIDEWYTHIHSHYSDIPNINITISIQFQNYKTSSCNIYNIEWHEQLANSNGIDS